MYTLAALIGLLALTWILQGNDFFLFKVFAPKYEAVRRTTFEQSRAFNQGMVQELENFQAEYLREQDPKAKAALRSIILHRASGYDLNDHNVTPELRAFIQELRSQQ